MAAFQGDVTLSEVFIKVIEEDVGKFAVNLAALQNGRSCFTSSTSALTDDPIKAAVFEKYNDSYYAYFAKVPVPPPNQRLPKQDECFSVSELSALTGMDLSPKSAAGTPECLGKNHILGPLTYSDALCLQGAMMYFRHAYEAAEQGRKGLSKILTPKTEVMPPPGKRF